MEAYLRNKAFEDRAVQVMGLLYENPGGLTQDECALRLGMPTQTAAPRFSDLFKHGLVIRKPIPGTNDYETRVTRSKSRAAVCILAPDWQKSAGDYRARKKMERETKKSQRKALRENETLREIIADLVAIIEEQFPSKDADLTEALAVIRKEYL